MGRSEQGASRRTTAWEGRGARACTLLVGPLGLFDFTACIREPHSFCQGGRDCTLQCSATCPRTWDRGGTSCQRAGTASHWQAYRHIPPPPKADQRVCSSLLFSACFPSRVRRRQVGEAGNEPQENCHQRNTVTLSRLESAKRLGDSTPTPKQKPMPLCTWRSSDPAMQPGHVRRDDRRPRDQQPPTRGGQPVMSHRGHEPIRL